MRSGALPVQRLSGWQYEKGDGAIADGVHPAFCAAHPAQRFCAHPALRHLSSRKKAVSILADHPASLQGKISLTRYQRSKAPAVVSLL